MSDNEPIRLSIIDKAAHIILDRPPDNRMNLKFFECFANIMKTIKATSGLRAAVIYSSKRHFSAGADVEDIKQSIERPFLQGVPIKDIVDGSVMNNVSLFSELEQLPFPVIAAIGGFCTGSGLELALACNIRISSKDALYSSPELSWGIITGVSGSIRLERLVGKHYAKQIMLLGETMTAQEAYKIGLVNKVVNRNELMDTTLRMVNLFTDDKCSEGSRFIKNMAMTI